MWAGAAVDELTFAHIRERLSLDFFKWDCQVGDTSTLFRQPLLISGKTWFELKQMAEDLAAELMQAERELIERPDLRVRLGLPRQLRSLFEDAHRYGLPPAVVRTLRFDFHYSTEGWRISEVNSDVPGGYAEASCFTQLMADCLVYGRPAGNPANDWTDAMLQLVGDRGHVALLSAPGYLEDQQVTAFLASQLQKYGVETFLLHHPAQLKWKSGHASVISGGALVGIDVVIRFYQAEWLAKLPRRCGWEWFFAKARTPISNPGIAILTESKRFPLVWDAMSTKMTKWRGLLPECRDPVDDRWRREDGWIIKMDFSNTGDEVHIRELMDRRSWEAVCRTVKKNPDHWIAQKRFEPQSIASDLGAIYPCIGIYTIDGRAAGVYARVATSKVIDYQAMDAALLIVES